MLTKKNEALRFNEGKVRFSLIDFDMFQHMRNAFPYAALIKDTDECISKIILTLSLIVYTNNKETYASLLIQLQAYSYLLSLFLLDRPFYASKSYDLTAFEAMAKVLEYGCTKYDEGNWKKGYINKFSSADSLFRHLHQIATGELNDEESGLPHIGHLMCNVMFLTNDLLYVKRDE